MSTRMDEAEAFFAESTKGHKMEVARNGGLYRHLKFRGERHTYWFDLVTWPGVLTITGDCGTFVFTRLPDMFAFFRGPTINTSYWAEKVIAEDRVDGVKEFSRDKFVDAVLCAMASWEGLDDPAELPKKLYDRLKKEAEGWSDEGKHEALRRAYEYTDDEGMHPFQDFWEYTVDDYTVQFLWCLHAIRWGIEQYDNHKKGEVS